MRGVLNTYFHGLSCVTFPLTYLQYTKTSDRRLNNAAQLLFYSFPTNSLLAYLDFSMSFGNWATLSLLKLKKKKKWLTEITLHIIQI